jgi:hypothetical protein
MRIGVSLWFSANPDDLRSGFDMISTQFGGYIRVHGPFDAGAVAMAMYGMMGRQDASEDCSMQVWNSSSSSGGAGKHKAM